MRTRIVVVSMTCAGLAACFGSSNSSAPSSPEDSGAVVPDATVEASGPAAVDAAPEAMGPDEAGPIEAASDAAAFDAASEAAPVDAASDARDGGDAASPDAGDGDTGVACSIVGTWTGTYSCASMDGEMYTWAINSDGTATGTITGGGSVQQTWSISGDTFTIETDSSCGSSLGVYTASFNASCTQLTLTEISDACTGRGSCVDGLVSTRQ
jgi:hypothetical protein